MTDCGNDECEPCGEARIETPRVPGAVERTVLRDLARAGKLDTGVRGTLAEMAQKLAVAFDTCSTEDIAALAKLNAELRQTLSRLDEAGNADRGTLAGILEALSNPVKCENCGQ